MTAKPNGSASVLVQSGIAGSGNVPIAEVEPASKLLRLACGHGAVSSRAALGEIGP
jgi:hypothetical protein